MTKQTPKQKSIFPHREPILSGLIRAQPSFMLMLSLTVAFMLSLWLLMDVWLVVFAASLVAILILSLVDMLKGLPVVGVRLGKLPHIANVLIVTLLLLSVMLTLVVLFGQELLGQFDEMKKALPQAFEQVKLYVRKFPMLQEWLGDNLAGDSDNRLKALMTKLSDNITVNAAMIGHVLGGITTFVAILLIGLFLAISPNIYVRSAIRLTPVQHRARTSYLLSRTYIALKRWLLGQFVVMLFVGVMTAIGLYIMGVPFALALGFLAFLLDFIPVLGPWLAAVPLLLTVMLFSPEMLVWAVVLVIVVQQLESYVVAPFVQNKLVDLPPVALLLSQLIMGGLTGFLGIALATPLMVMVIVWVQILYVKFVLGDYKISVMGQSDGELKDDPFNELPDETIYADMMTIDARALDVASLNDTKLYKNNAPSDNDAPHDDILNNDTPNKH